MNIKELVEWVKKYSIEEKTIKCFKEFLINYQLESPEEYKIFLGESKKEELEYQIHTISLNLGNWPKCTYNTISASLWIFCNNKQIGSYKILYTFDGVPEDDFFDLI